MELKGKVSVIRKCWGDMYRTTAEESGSKPEVEVELAGGRGTLRFTCTPAEAKAYRLGDELVVEVQSAAEDALEREPKEE